jgi:hypothetical protein
MPSSQARPESAKEPTPPPQQQIQQQPPSSYRNPLLTNKQKSTARANSNARDPNLKEASIPVNPAALSQHQQQMQHQISQSQQIANQTGMPQVQQFTTTQADQMVHEKIEDDETR